MPRRSLNELIQQSGINLPDNNTQAITPADVRTLIIDFLDTLVPSYGGLLITARSQLVNATPAALVFMNQITTFPPEFVLDTALGTITRNLVGIPRAVTRFVINGDVHGPSGSDLRLTLYANEQPLIWQQFVTGRGTNNRTTFSFDALDGIDVDTVYTLRVSAPTGTPTFAFENVAMIAENVPIRDFSTVIDPALRFDYTPPPP